MSRFTTATLLLWLLSVTPASAQQPLPKQADYYTITSLPIPPEVVLEVGALELLPDGRMAAASRRGDIYFISNPFGSPDEMRLTRFASGLHEVLGLAYREGAIYATQRGEVTRLRDQDGDDRADTFETVCDDWGLSGDYHEYAFGSPFDRDGNLWVVLCLTGSFTSEVPYRGWCVRVTPEGKMLPTCSGLRSPGGIGMNAEGDMFYTDNQGPWNGTCGLKHLRPGAFLGHPGGNHWYTLTDALGPRPPDPNTNSRMMIEADRIPELEPTAVFFPYQKMGQSASGIACDMSGGKFGPFEKQLFVGDQTHSTVMRVFLEKVNGHYQGACFPFIEGLECGSVALRMTPEGALFVGGTNRGWGSRGSQPFSLDRIEWTGKMPFEVEEMRAKPDGFELVFTEPLERESAGLVGSYTIETYTYLYRADYGSPEVDHTKPVIERAEVSPDGQRVRLFVQGLQRGHIHELHLPGVRNQAGAPLLHSVAYYTLNYIPNQP